MKITPKNIVEYLPMMIEELDALARDIDLLPDNIEYTQDQIAILDDTRHSAQRLADAALTAIQTFQGDK